MTLIGAGIDFSKDQDCSATGMWWRYPFNCALLFRWKMQRVSDTMDNALYL